MASTLPLPRAADGQHSGRAAFREARPAMSSRLRITSRGVGLSAGAVVLLAAGFRFGYPELALVGASAALALALALAHVMWRPRLTVGRKVQPDRVARGEPSLVTLAVRNHGRLSEVELLAEDRCADRSVAVPLPRLRPGRETTVCYPVPTTRRGVVPVGPLRVTRRDPLGLLSLVRAYGGVVDVCVYPRVHPLSVVPAGSNPSLDGRLDRVPHGSITFDALRPYVPGDELRSVHWRTSARIGQLMVREHVDTSLPRIVLVLDNRPDAHPTVRDGVTETFESACEAAASVVVAATREELPVSLLLVCEEEEEGPGWARPAAGSCAGGGSRAGGGSLPELLGRLAAASLRHPTHDTTRDSRGRPHRRDHLRILAGWLRARRLGDTLIFLTGPGAREDLEIVGMLPGAYLSVVVGVFGTDEVTETGGGLVVIDARDCADFAAEWNGIHRC